MPGFTLSGSAAAPVEDVWKLLFDPARYPEWWAGIESVVLDGPGEFTQWMTGFPDDPMPQVMSTERSSGRISISCQVHDVDVAWRLASDGPRTAVEVRVAIGETAAHKQAPLRNLLTRSVASLVALAEREHRPGADVQ